MDGTVCALIEGDEDGSGVQESLHEVRAFVRGRSCRGEAIRSKLLISSRVGLRHDGVWT